MDIESYPEFKENILYVRDKESPDFNKYIATSVEDFYKLVLKHKEIITNNNEESEKKFFKKDIYYRGQANKKWEIKCSLFRNSLIEKEEQLIQEVLNRKPFDFINCKNNLEKLILMQHYGIPTRLLDITLNPLVALYFSCQGESESDGVVYIFEEENEVDFNSSEIVSNFSFFKDNDTLDNFKKLLEKEKIIFDVSKIYSLLNKKYILVNPKLNNNRIIAQQGLFLCCSNNSTEGKTEDNIQIKKKDFSIEAVKKIIISHEFKKNILKELEFLGIKKSVLFPELENHADELIEKFSIKHDLKSKNQKDNNKDLETSNEVKEEYLEKTNNLIKEIESFVSENLLKEKLLSLIDKNFYLFDNKKAIVKNLIRRDKNIEEKIKNKLIKMIEE